jgi:phage recombination protein Bet
MSAAVVALPQSSDPTVWSPEERALVEAAGLVHTDAQSGAKTLAERPVVAAFLQHCQRTGLDPIARQIYSIARKSKGQLKWQIQISIDGARLVAERSGQYEGQTTPEFTADGITWTQVWLSNEPPKAARVGVYRRGFRDALYAVALWDAYVQTNYKGEVTDMWRKMGPLMLAKCCEMLALRKAFPQDLSGLYSSEEMSQADTPVAPVAPVAAVVQEQIPAPTMTHNWPVLLRTQVRTVEQLRTLYADAQGELGVVLADAAEVAAAAEQFGLDAPPAGVTVEQLFRAVRQVLLDAEAGPSEDVVDAVVVPDEGWATAAIPGEEQAA